MNSFPNDYEIALRLMEFLNASPVSYLAVATVEEQLEAAGFRCFDPRSKMQKPEPGETFYVTKNNSSIYAFRIGRQPLSQAGFRLICAHSDSPTFRIKPKPEITGAGNVMRLNVEPYGGAILYSWFDRPLSIAGRVMLRTSNPLHPVTQLIHIKRPLLMIPSLAIHLNRNVNDSLSISRQNDMLPVLGLITSQLEQEDTLLKLIAQELEVPLSIILDFDLYLYDTTPATQWGLHQEFISSGRLDDLSMVHAGLEALINADEIPEATQILAIFDNEETGSGTKQGAQSPFLRSIIERIVLSQEDSLEGFYRAVEKSFMISADCAHACHPNHPEKSDPTVRTTMGNGPVIKFNAAQKYATDADGAAVFAAICEEAGVPYQKFVNHSDIAGGSTLGNILTTSLPLRGVDMGNPLWGMHSICETICWLDQVSTISAFTTFYNE